MYPEDLKYTSEHEWVRSPGEAEGSVRVGITDYAQDALGDIVYVSLPEVGAEVEAGAAVGELESTKSVSDVYAPLAGHGRRPQRGARRHPRAGQHRPVRRGLAVRDRAVGRGRGRRAAGRRGVPGPASSPERRGFRLDRPPFTDRFVPATMNLD